MYFTLLEPHDEHGVDTFVTPGIVLYNSVRRERAKEQIDVPIHMFLMSSSE
jgi:hypothetical protein